MFGKFISAALDTTGKKKSDLSKGNEKDTDDDKGSIMDKVSDGIETLSYKKGGIVKKTGLARLHKGERVLNKKQTKKYNSHKRA